MHKAVFLFCTVRTVLRVNHYTGPGPGIEQGQTWDGVCVSEHVHVKCVSESVFVFPCSLRGFAEFEFGSRFGFGPHIRFRCRFLFNQSADKLLSKQRGDNSKLMHRKKAHIKKIYK